MSAPVHPRRLTLDDIEDLRAYEREREKFRNKVIDLKRKRRVPVGPLLTVLFENRETIRFQIQEMVRIERMLQDEQVQTELDVYNPLIPEPGELSATLFVELTSEEALREWLPKLVGIEQALELRIGAESSSPWDVVRATPEEAHAEALTRETVTASVHYIRFSLTPAQIDRFQSDPVTLAAAHDAYSEATALSEETKAELLSDLRD